MARPKQNGSGGNDRRLPFARLVAAVVATSSGAATIYGLFSDKRIAFLSFPAMLLAVLLMALIHKAVNEIARPAKRSSYWDIMARVLAGFLLLCFILGSCWLFPSVIEWAKKAFVQKESTPKNVGSDGSSLRIPSESFSVTVLVHGEKGPHDLPLRNSGVVRITLGSDLREEGIGDKGQADFKNIPPNFLGQEVPISVDAEEFEASPAHYVLDKGNVSLTVRRKPIILTGRVQDPNGNPVTNAVIRIGAGQAVVNTIGRFQLTLTSDGSSSEIRAEVTAPGFELWRGLMQNGGDNSVLLRHAP